MAFDSPRQRDDKRPSVRRVRRVCSRTIQRMQFDRLHVSPVPCRIGVTLGSALSELCDCNVRQRCRYVSLHGLPSWLSVIRLHAMHQLLRRSVRVQ